jgi:hypothetical protein
VHLKTFKQFCKWVLTTQTWTNGQITWTATDARTDQLLNATKPITIKNGSLTSTAVLMASRTLQLLRNFFSGSAELLNLMSMVEVGSIPYSTTITTTTIRNKRNR